MCGMTVRQPKDQLGLTGHWRSCTIHNLKAAREAETGRRLGDHVQFRDLIKNERTGSKA